MSIHKNRLCLLPFLFTLLAHAAFCQTNVPAQVLSKTQWTSYFAKYFNLKSPESIKTDIATNSIPYPAVWKYTANKETKNKYRLYTLSDNHDYMTMPSNNGVGTYLFYFDHKNPEKNMVEMNFMADSISCKKLATDVFMFQLTDNEFKINDDSNGFNRYVFTDSQGRFASKAIVAHGCTLSMNNIDTVHSVIYLNVNYPKHITCSKCFRFDYKNFLMLTTLDKAGDLNGAIVIDAVHYCSIKKVESEEK